jgi:nucleoside-diphosphate-sugar epimerase
VKALLIGGTRFIGRRLAGELLDRGAKVWILTRGKAQDDLGDRVRRLIADRRAPGALRLCLAGLTFDVAYDLISYDASDAAGAIEALDGRIAHFVHMSTCSVYWCAGEFSCPVPEEQFARVGEFDERPGSIEYAYGYGKLQAEQELFAAHRERMFPVTIIRSPVVGGEGDPSLRYASYCLRVADGKPICLPDSGLAPFRQAYVGDLARAMADLPGRPGTLGEAINLAGHEILSVARVVKGIADLMDREVETVDIPSAVLREMGLVTRAEGNLFSPFSQQAAQVPSIGKARRLLRWRPTGFDTWLERVVRTVMEAREAGTLPSPPAYSCRSRELKAIEQYQQALARR